MKKFLNVGLLGIAITLGSLIGNVQAQDLSQENCFEVDISKFAIAKNGARSIIEETEGMICSNSKKNMYEMFLQKLQDSIGGEISLNLKSSQNEKIIKRHNELETNKYDFGVSRNQDEIGTLSIKSETVRFEGEQLEKIDIKTQIGDNSTIEKIVGKKLTVENILEIRKNLSNESDKKVYKIK